MSFPASNVQTRNLVFLNSKSRVSKLVISSSRTHWELRVHKLEISRLWTRNFEFVNSKRLWVNWGWLNFVSEMSTLSRATRSSDYKITPHHDDFRPNSPHGHSRVKGFVSKETVVQRRCELKDEDLVSKTLIWVKLTPWKDYKDDVSSIGPFAHVGKCFRFRHCSQLRYLKVSNFLLNCIALRQKLIQSDGQEGEVLWRR